MIDIYTPVLGRSPLIDEMLGRIQRRIERELGFQKELMRLRGALDMTLAQAAMTQMIEA
jgi:U3 small nucleolar RNA-associated protein 15